MFVKRNKSHGKVYLNFVEGYVENGKVKHRVVEKIGFEDELKKIYDDPYEHFTRIARERTKEKNESLILKIDPNLTLSTHTNKLGFLGYFPFKKLYGKVGLPVFFNNLQRNYKISYRLNSVFLFLLLSRILLHCSVKKAFESKDCFFEKFDFSLKQAYRAYDYFFKNKNKIIKQLYKGVSKIYDYKTTTCRYDTTNYYFEIRYNDDDEIKGEEIVSKGLRKKGYSKENRRTPICQMGLLLDENGIPMTYNLFPGNESEKLSLRPSLKDAKKQFKAERIIVVADRGINTEGNCAYLAKGTGDGYIYGNSIRKEEQDFKDWVIDQSDYIKDELDEIDPKTGKPVQFKHKARIGLVPKTVRDENGKDLGDVYVKEKVMVYYSQKYADREKKQRDLMIEKAKIYKKYPGKYQQAISKGAAAYIKEVEPEEKQEENKEESPETENNNKEKKKGKKGRPKKKKKIDIDWEKIKEEEKLDGYFSIITSETEMDDKELRDIYKELWEIEESFKITKQELETRPVYMSLQEHIEVHFLICFAALLFIRLVEFKTDHKFGYAELLKSLRKFNCGHIEGNYYNTLYYDEVLDELAKVYDLKLNRAYLTKKEIKGILKYE